MIAVDPSAAERGHAGAVCACGGSPARPVRVRLPQWRAPETRDLCARHEAEARAEGLVVEGGELVKLITGPVKAPAVEVAMAKPALCLVSTCTEPRADGGRLCADCQAEAERQKLPVRATGTLPTRVGQRLEAAVANRLRSRVEELVREAAAREAADAHQDNEEVAALREEIARLTAAQAEFEAALAKETEAAQRMTKYAHDTERMRVSVRDDILRLRKELEGWRSPKTAADDEIDAALDDAEIPSDGPRHERVRALADQAMADQRVVESLREILTAALGPDAEGKSPLALVEQAAARLGRHEAPVAPAVPADSDEEPGAIIVEIGECWASLRATIGPTAKGVADPVQLAELATEELGRLDSLAHQRAAHAKGLQETLADAQAADQQVREILAPVLGLDVTGAPAATMAEQAAAALKGTHDALDQLGVPYLTGRAGETPAKRILAHALTVGDVLDEEGCPDPHGPLVDRIRAWAAERAKAPSEAADATEVERLREEWAEERSDSLSAHAALAAVGVALADEGVPTLAENDSLAARIRAHFEAVHLALDAAGCPDEDDSGDPGLVGRIGAWAQELGEALDEAGAPPTPSIVARLAAWAAHARPLMEAAEEADDALRAVGAPDDDALAVYRMGLRIRAWAEEHASDVDRARAQGRAEARDRLITRLHDSEPLRLGAAAVVAPGSRALREAARSSDAAGPLALDLLDVREEGAPPPRQPVHPALVDLDGAPIRLELMGHRVYEGVLTALGGASYRIAPLDGEAVYGVWGSAIYAARVIDPEGWAARIARLEEAAQLERQEAEVPLWRRVRVSRYAGHIDGDGWWYVEEIDGSRGRRRRLGASADKTPLLLLPSETPGHDRARLAFCTLHVVDGDPAATIHEWGAWEAGDAASEDGNGEIPW